MAQGGKGFFMLDRLIHYAPEHGALQRQFLMRRNILGALSAVLPRHAF